VLRYACADGWALATDGHRVAVFEQHGRSLDQPLGHRWLRVGVGTVPLLSARIEFAASRSLLQRLGHRIAVQIPSAPRVTVPPDSPPMRWQRAPIRVSFRPGDSYLAEDLTHRPNVLVVTINSATRPRRVLRYRWRDGGWVRFRSE
jgi:hypothetical protein